MKLRRIFVASLTALSLLLTSCGGSQLEEPLTQEYETIIGEFKSLAGIKVDDMITHLFEDEDGSIYYAFSDRYDLDEEVSTRIEVAGLVMDYESLDKPAFKVTRISEAPEVVIDDSEITMVDYVDTEIGFSMTYPDNWSFESFRDSVQLTAPETEVEEGEEVPEPDVIVVAVLEAELRTTSEDDTDSRTTDVNTQVTQIYPDLAHELMQSTLIGEDKQFALRYNVSAGSMHYFVPRGSELIEVSFYHPSTENYLDNRNIFAEMVNSFRLLPTGEDGEIIEEDPTETEEEITEENPVEETVEEVEIIEEVIEEDPTEEVEESVETEEVVSNDTQLSLEDYREFESNPYKFKISYPKHWYYSGGNQGYDFSTDPIEDDSEALIRLDINSTTSTGTVRTGSTVKITVEVEGQYYTITGPSEYEEVMQNMVNSVQAVKVEEA